MDDFVIVIFIIIVIMVAYFLFSREVHCWYLKTNKILSRLDSLEYKLLKGLNIEIDENEFEQKQDKQDNDPINSSSVDQIRYSDANLYNTSFPLYGILKKTLKKEDKSEE